MVVMEENDPQTSGFGDLQDQLQKANDLLKSLENETRNIAQQVIMKNHGSVHPCRFRPIFLSKIPILSTKRIGTSSNNIDESLKPERDISTEILSHTPVQETNVVDEELFNERATLIKERAGEVQTRATLLNDEPLLDAIDGNIRSARVQEGAEKKVQDEFIEKASKSLDDLTNRHRTLESNLALFEQPFKQDDLVNLVSKKPEERDRIRLRQAIDKLINNPPRKPVEKKQKENQPVLRATSERVHPVSMASKKIMRASKTTRNFISCSPVSYPIGSRKRMFMQQPYSPRFIPLNTRVENGQINLMLSQPPLPVTLKVETCVDTDPWAPQVIHYNSPTSNVDAVASAAAVSNCPNNIVHHYHHHEGLSVPEKAPEPLDIRKLVQEVVLELMPRIKPDVIYGENQSCNNNQVASKEAQYPSQLPTPSSVPRTQSIDLSGRCRSRCRQPSNSSHQQIEPKPKTLTLTGTSTPSSCLADSCVTPECLNRLSSGELVCSPRSDGEQNYFSSINPEKYKKISFGIGPIKNQVYSTTDDEISEGEVIRKPLRKDVPAPWEDAVLQSMAFKRVPRSLEQEVQLNQLVKKLSSIRNSINQLKNKKHINDQGLAPYSSGEDSFVQQLDQIKMTCYDSPSHDCRGPQCFSGKPRNISDSNLMKSFLSPQSRSSRRTVEEERDSRPKQRSRTGERDNPASSRSIKNRGVTRRSLSSMPSTSLDLSSSNTKRPKPAPLRGGPDVEDLNQTFLSDNSQDIEMMPPTTQPSSPATTSKSKFPKEFDSLLQARKSLEVIKNQQCSPRPPSDLNKSLPSSLQRMSPKQSSCENNSATEEYEDDFFTDISEQPQLGGSNLLSTGKMIEHAFRQSTDSDNQPVSESSNAF